MTLDATFNYIQPRSTPLPHPRYRLAQHQHAAHPDDIHLDACYRPSLYSTLLDCVHGPPFERRGIASSRPVHFMRVVDDWGECDRFYDQRERVELGSFVCCGQVIVSEAFSLMILSIVMLLVVLRSTLPAGKSCTRMQLVHGLPYWSRHTIWCQLEVSL
jgi:hypothetical protein